MMSVEDAHDDSELRLSYHRVDMDLISDIDIQNVMLRSASAETLPTHDIGTPVSFLCYVVVQLSGLFIGLVQLSGMFNPFYPLQSQCCYLEYLTHHYIAVIWTV